MLKIYYSIPAFGFIIEFIMEHSVYRIIDANFNRAREAARVIEEFCRFALNSESLTAQAKKLRHELCDYINKLDTALLIAARDTLGDVGTGQTVANQLQRNTIYDCLTAGCKRLTEALRAIAEVTQTINPSVAKTIERLRYDAYTLEKDIFLFSNTVEKFKHVRLYVIVTSNSLTEVRSLTKRCIAGMADCIQLRAKNINDDVFLALAGEFVSLCKKAGVISIINDRIDIAVAVGADGVHLGQNDLSVTQARKLELTPLIIGKSTHSLDQLHNACKENPTYVAIGPVFTTDTKPNVPAVGLNYVKNALEILADTGICHVAIGGINSSNVERVLRAGATTIAACSAVTAESDPAESCRVLKEKIVKLKP
jgi:thiamine-phosphate pyrophosphorylase